MTKKKIIKGIMIDVKNLTVEEITFKNSLEGFYEKLECDLITKIPCPIDDNHDLVLDDEGLYKENQTFFTFDLGNMDATYCGNALIVSFDEEGNWTSHSLNVDEVRRQVSFLKFFRIGGETCAVILEKH